VNLFYIANIRMPTEKAHGLQIMKTCEAFAASRVDVELIVSNRRTNIDDDPFAYYGIRQKFTLSFLRTPNLLRGGVVGFALTAFSAGVAAARIVRRQTSGIIYSRDALVLWTMLWLCSNDVVWEPHAGTWNIFTRRVARKARAIVVISEGLRAFYVEKGVPASKLHVAHDGIDLEDFAHPESQEASRRRLGLPLEEKLALYIGRLDGWKGATVFCDSASLLPDGIRAVVIGGESAQVQTFSARYPRVIFVGPRPYREIADNQAAADVLVLPNTGKDIVSVSFTSPLKLFTYMASGRPIVASDLPSIREVLSERNAVLVPADDPLAIATAIQHCIEHPETSAALAPTARGDVEKYTWQARAEGILSHLGYVKDRNTAPVDRGTSSAYWQRTIGHELGADAETLSTSALGTETGSAKVSSRVVLWQWEDAEYGLRNMRSVRRDRRLLTLGDEVMESYRRQAAGEAVDAREFAELYRKANEAWMSAGRQRQLFLARIEHRLAWVGGKRIAAWMNRGWSEAWNWILAAARPPGQGQVSVLVWNWARAKDGKMHSSAYDARVRKLDEMFRERMPL
jgi:glycosyltransferase involved in cell wall biosynthesis